VLALGVAALSLTGSKWIGCGNLPFLVTGRIVDARTGRPVGDAWLGSFHSEGSARDAESVAHVREWHAEWLRYRAPDDVLPIRRGADTTAEDGTFRMAVAIPWSSSGWGFGPVSCSSSSTPPPRHGLRWLRVEAPGERTSIVELHGGTWTQHAGRGRGSYVATWDVGDIAVDFDGQPDGARR
jgi:hypothetical protein